jgi:hypothetical protein
MTPIELKHELVIDIRGFKAYDLALCILSDNLVSELIKFALEKDQLLSSRAMWVLSHASDIDYNCIKPYHTILIDHLKTKDLHDGVIRNILRLYQKKSVPENKESFMLDKCYSFIQNPSFAIAIRAFAITVVFNISKTYPELLQELKIVLSHMNISEEGPGIRARVKNTLKDIDKILYPKKNLKIKFSNR